MSICVHVCETKWWLRLDLHIISTFRGCSQIKIIILNVIVTFGGRGVNLVAFQM